MIYDKNKFFVINGKAFTVGDEVICTDSGDFDGLRGIITQINTDKNCFYPEHKYEIIVDMFNPDDPNIQKRLISSPVCEGKVCVELADEYDFSLILKGIVFPNADSLELYDRNVKALKPYSCATEVESLKAYIVTIEHDLGENNTEVRNSVCYSDVNDAMKALSRAIAVVQDTYRPWLVTSENICITVGEDRFIATTEKNYLQVTLTVADVSINPAQQRLLSEEYEFAHHIEDVRGKLYERWQEEVLSDEDYCHLYKNAPKLTRAFEDAYDDNQCRADCFWDIIDYVIDNSVEEDD